MQTSLTLDWADGSYDFRLTWTGCAEVERKADAGIQVIYQRVLLGAAYAIDVAEIIRQALLGGTGGVVDGEPVETKPAVVNRLVERYVTGPEARPFGENWTVAQAILNAFMVGHESTAAQKKRAVAPEETTESTLPRSSPTAP